MSTVSGMKQMTISGNLRSQIGVTVLGFEQIAAALLDHGSGRSNFSIQVSAGTHAGFEIVTV